MISFTIEDAKIRQYGINSTWYVGHPSNDSVLAYCDTKEEAIAVREAINDLARVLRETGQKVR